MTRACCGHGRFPAVRNHPSSPDGLERKIRKPFRDPPQIGLPPASVRDEDQ
jgi:hypothetical protein